MNRASVHVLCLKLTGAPDSIDAALSAFDGSADVKPPWQHALATQFTGVRRPNPGFGAIAFLSNDPHTGHLIHEIARWFDDLEIHAIRLSPGNDFEHALFARGCCIGMHPIQDDIPIEATPNAPRPSFEEVATALESPGAWTTLGTVNDRVVGIYHIDVDELRHQAQYVHHIDLGARYEIGGDVPHPRWAATLEKAYAIGCEMLEYLERELT